jgi:hypothetical protein
MIMYKKSLLLVLMLVLMLMCMTSVQCTEDETIEASVSQSDVYLSESGEEGDQELDNERD